MNINRRETALQIGIIGRTGAGKTSLVSMLFRLNELSSGRVLLAGEDASRIDLAILRSNMAIIPQVRFPNTYMILVLCYDNRIQILHLNVISKYEINRK